MLHLASATMSDEDDDDDPDCHDNDYLEFILYSQLHYEMTDRQSDSHADIQSHRQTDRRTPSLDPCSESLLGELGARSKLVAMAPGLDAMPLAKPIERLIHRDTDPIPGTQCPRKGVGRKKFKKTSRDKTIIIDSDSSETSCVKIVKVERKRKLEKLSVEKKCTTGKKRSKFNNFVVSIEDSSESADVLSDVSDNIHLHITQHQRVLQSDVTGDKWQINDEDRMAGIVHSRTNPRARKFGGAGLAGRYYRPSSVTCYNCKEVGHLSKDCQKPKKSEICVLCGFTGHYFRKCPQALCYNCNQTGHDAKQCSSRRQSVYDRCHRCYMHGHIQQQCPDLWRQFHLTTPESPCWPVHGDPKSINKRKSCYNCGSKKHFGFDCSLETMEHHMLPTYSLIAKYDKWKDLQKLFSADNTKSKTTSIKKVHKKKAHKKDKCQKVKTKSDSDELETLTPLSAFMQNELELLDSYVCEKKSKRRKVKDSHEGGTKSKANDHHVSCAKKLKVNHAHSKKVKDGGKLDNTKKFQRNNGNGEKVINHQNYRTTINWSNSSATKVKDNYSWGTKIKDNYSGGTKVKDNYGRGTKKVGSKKKSRNWDSQFTAFSDTGKPVRNSSKRKGKRKSQNMQRAAGSGGGGTSHTSGFHISRTVRRMISM